ncbi:MAG: serine O-acetyltransferase EpsC [Thermoguttaceae bacterium]
MNYCITMDEMRHDFSRVTDLLVGTYLENTATNHLDACPLPNHETVLTILNRLRAVLFPGYYGQDRLNRDNITYYTGALLDQISVQLSDQIYRALCQELLRENLPVTDSLELRLQYETEGRRIAAAFLDSLATLNRTLALDVEAAFVGDPACKSRAEVVFCYPGFAAVTVYRIAHQLHILGVPLIPRMMSESVHSQTGIDIHPGATIGDHFFIDHGTGVVIGETCVIGNWVKLYQGVTLGALSIPRDSTNKPKNPVQRHPTIDDHVVIYANATVLGGETVVGKGSIIGSNAWITESVPPSTLVTIEKPNLCVKTRQ